MKPGRVLIAPLDWGLGHATRCIPIINQLLQEQYAVVLAGSGPSLELLRMEFPTLSCHELPAYDPAYSMSNTLVWKMASQLRKFIRTIKQEYDAVQQIVEEEKITIILSDNRYGCWSARTKNIFISHQLTIVMPRGLNWAGIVVNWFNRRQIEKFNRCWVPDWPGPANFSGKLSVSRMPCVSFIGPLSRFNSSSPTEMKAYDLLILLSGPEPQRSMLEQILFDQLDEIKNLRIAIVRGAIQEPSLAYPPHITVFNFPSSTVLQRVIEGSEMVVSRSGYSTIMDMAQLQKRIIFIPTPGQTEQLYLAMRMKEKRIAYFADQKNFDLSRALAKSKDYTGFVTDSFNTKLLQEGIESLMGSEIQNKT